MNISTEICLSYNCPGFIVLLNLDIASKSCVLYTTHIRIKRHQTAKYMQEHASIFDQSICLHSEISMNRLRLATCS